MQMVAFDENTQALGVEPQHVAHAVVLDVDRALVRTCRVLGRVLGAGGIDGGDLLHLDHRRIAQRGEPRRGIVDIGDAAGHAGREVAPGVAQYHHHAAGHVLAAVVAGALDDADRARIAHGEAFAGDAFEIGFSGDGAVENRVADDDVLQRIARRALGLADHDAAARQPFADIVVGVAHQFDRHAARQEGAETLSGGAGKLHRNGVVGEPDVSGPPGNLAGEHRPHGPVDVGDR